MIVLAKSPEEVLDIPSLDEWEMLSELDEVLSEEYLTEASRTTDGAQDAGADEAAQLGIKRGRELEVSRASSTSDGSSSATSTDQGASFKSPTHPAPNIPLGVASVAWGSLHSWLLRNLDRWYHPQTGDYVTCLVRMWLLSGRDLTWRFAHAAGDSPIYLDPISFTVGGSSPSFHVTDVPKGLDALVRELCVGQRAYALLSSDWAFGDQILGSNQHNALIPPRAPIVISVQLLSVSTRDYDYNPFTRKGCLDVGDAEHASHTPSPAPEVFTGFFDDESDDSDEEQVREDEAVSCTAEDSMLDCRNTTNMQSKGGGQCATRNTQHMQSSKHSHIRQQRPWIATLHNAAPQAENKTHPVFSSVETLVRALELKVSAARRHIMQSSEFSPSRQQRALVALQAALNVVRSVVRTSNIRSPKLTGSLGVVHQSEMPQKTIQLNQLAMRGILNTAMIVPTPPFPSLLLHKDKVIVPPSGALLAGRMISSRTALAATLLSNVRALCTASAQRSLVPAEALRASFLRYLDNFAMLENPATSSTSCITAAYLNGPDIIEAHHAMHQRTPSRGLEELMTDLWERSPDSMDFIDPRSPRGTNFLQEMPSTRGNMQLPANPSELSRIYERSSDHDETKILTTEENQSDDEIRIDLPIYASLSRHDRFRQRCENMTMRVWKQRQNLVNSLKRDCQAEISLDMYSRFDYELTDVAFQHVNYPKFKKLFLPSPPEDTAPLPTEIKQLNDDFANFTESFVSPWGLPVSREQCTICSLLSMVGGDDSEAVSAGQLKRVQHDPLIALAIDNGNGPISRNPSMSDLTDLPPLAEVDEVAPQEMIDGKHSPSLLELRSSSSSTLHSDSTSISPSPSVSPVANVMGTASGTAPTVSKPKTIRLKGWAQAEAAREDQAHIPPVLPSDQPIDEILADRLIDFDSEFSAVFLYRQPAYTGLGEFERVHRPPPPFMTVSTHQVSIVHSQASSTTIGRLSSSTQPDELDQRVRKFDSKGLCKECLARARLLTLVCTSAYLKARHRPPAEFCSTVVSSQPCSMPGVFVEISHGLANQPLSKLWELYDDPDAEASAQLATLAQESWNAWWALGVLTRGLDMNNPPPDLAELLAHVGAPKSKARPPKIPGPDSSVEDFIAFAQYLDNETVRELERMLPCTSYRDPHRPRTKPTSFTAPLQRVVSPPGFSHQTNQ